MAITRRATSIAFAENQLSPGLIGLSPLTTGHPRLFQQTWVRPSSGCYPTFSLPMARSPGFGSDPANWTPCSDSLSLRLGLPAQARSRDQLADPLYKRYAVTGQAPLPLLVGIRFQVCFTPLVGVLFTFPSRYWCTIGHRGVLRLGGWSPHVQTGFHVSRPTQGRTDGLPVRGCHPLWPAFPDGSGSDPHATGLVPFRSPLLGESRLMSFPPATEMFQFAGFASILQQDRYRLRGGLPHSEIFGS